MENKLDELENKFFDYLAEELYKKLRNKRVFSVWLSYDLGLKEDASKVTNDEYEKLYQTRYEQLINWLKNHDAQECGKSVATFIAMSSDVQRLVSALKSELKEIKIEGNGIRVYAIISDLADFTSKQSDFEQNKIRYAGFIIGQREAAAWEENKKPSYKNVDIE